MKGTGRESEIMSWNKSEQIQSQQTNERFNGTESEVKKWRARGIKRVHERERDGDLMG